AYLFKREGIGKALASTPEAVQMAARYAYAGGRFEVIKFGHSEDRCYEYDVNSAYPTALCNVPNLVNGEWRHIVSADADRSYPFALYHIKWRIRRTKRHANIPGPLFRRLKTGNVHYPLAGEGWYWTPEYLAAKAYAETVGGTFTISEAWVFDSATDVKPFGFIPKLYAERRELKKADNGAHVGIKLALNSMYGKLAQQVGWHVTPRGTLKLPPFHQLEWAGYVTSHCRAAVLTAALQDIDSVIAFETDALFTSRPLRLDTGEELGQFEVTEFLDLTYMQSGTYYGRAVDKKTGEVKELTAKTRGIDRGSMSRDDCLALMAEPIAVKRKVSVTNRRFFTLGLALMQSMDKWTKWLEVTKEVTLEPTGKRFHDPVCGCSGPGITKGIWHTTICPTAKLEHSAEFPVEWVKPSAVADLFRMIREDDDVLDVDNLASIVLESS
ncbi:MAG: hypothetical protein KDA17_00670, partial [Candidatus Saccharibacteria bacterium]|nr:hypothetical protein [Candidatus Saccharibacteria bacterium]